MQDSHQTALIEVSQLLLDPENPRLTSVQANSHDAIRAMTRVQGERVIALAQHLLENGANPSSLMMVMPSSHDRHFFYVLDGNRRLTALKLLESPLLAEGILSKKNLQALKRLSKEFERTPITRLSCVVFNSRNQADPWIQLTHRGLNKGAGMLAWDGQVGARYDERQKGYKDISLQLLDFAKEEGILSDSTRQKIEDGKFPITTLNRILSTPYVRKKLGIEKAKEEILFLFPKEEVAKGLSRVIEDLASQRITVSDLKQQDQRINYINNFDTESLPDPHSVLPKPASIKQLSEHSTMLKSNSTEEDKPRIKAIDMDDSKIPDNDNSIDSNQGKDNFRPSPFQSRKTLIPRSCRIPIKQKRINDLFKELKQLDLNDFSNAGAVMLRVFIELSVDHFVEFKLGWDERKTGNSKLKDKLDTVAQYLENEGVMTRNELASTRKAATGDGMLAASVKSMNQYVHNRYYSPIASELIVIWDDFQIFIQKVWEIVE